MRAEGGIPNQPRRGEGFPEDVTSDLLGLTNEQMKRNRRLCQGSAGLPLGSMI